jgi:hypothetical protein
MYTTCTMFNIRPPTMGVLRLTLNSIQHIFIVQWGVERREVLRALNIVEN